MEITNKLKELMRTDYKYYLLFWVIYTPILYIMWYLTNGGLIELLAPIFIGGFNTIFYQEYLQYKLKPKPKEPEFLWTKVFEPDFGFKDLD